jgi:hypothetical protein
MMNHLLLITIATVCSFSSVSAVAEKTLFRYTNDQGGKVISDAIPPKYAARGYELIDSKGQLIKLVPPEPTPEEKAQFEKVQAEQRYLEKWDKELLSRYSTLNDIKATKKRRLEGMDNSIYSLRLTLSNISETIKHYQAEAASNERQGEKISDETLSSITRLQKDRDFIEEEIKRKEKIKQEVNDSYDADIKRFGEIKPEKS